MINWNFGYNDKETFLAKKSDAINLLETRFIASNKMQIRSGDIQTTTHSVMLRFSEEKLTPMRKSFLLSAAYGSA